MKVAIVIPARLQSTRLPRKLLLPLGDKPVIQHTFERAMRAKLAHTVVVATDSDEIRSIVKGFGGLSIKTSEAHVSGTSRIAEAALEIDADIIVNIQGDEPEINPIHIDALIETQIKIQAFVSTLACPFPESIRVDDPNCVKVVIGRRISADLEVYDTLYFSRAIVPFGEAADRYLHIGAYAFNKENLQKFSRLPYSSLERTENLEQLRILEHGEKIATRLIDRAVPGIDTQADLNSAMRRLSIQTGATSN